MFYWIRIGDTGSYQSFDDLDDAVDCLNENGAGKIDHWVDGGPGIGIDTPNFHGHDFISLFWGDNAANPIRSLNRWERAHVEKRLAEVLS
ncbi:MAG: hypothetical protein ACYC35_00300 [Pirellulales bacterium]